MKDEQRDWKIGQAFARAAEPPLEIARAAADVAELAAELAQDGLAARSAPTRSPRPRSPRPRRAGLRRRWSRST